MVVPRSSGPSLTVVAGSAGPAADRKPTLDDDAILAAVRRGDAGVAADFYRRIKPVVERTVRRLCGRADSDWEDLVQVASVQIIESLPTYRGECPLDPWLSAVAANVVYKHIRRRRLERRIFEDTFEAAERVEMPGAGGTRQMLLRDAIKRVTDQLVAMRPDRAWTFVLHDVCGYSLDEIAHICGISVTAAQSRLVRGRRELHERVADDPSLAEALERGEL